MVAFRLLAIAALLAGISGPASTGSKIPAPSIVPSGEDAGCSNPEGYLVDGHSGLIVTTADCGGTLRAWLTKSARQGENLATTDPSLVVDRLAAGKLGPGEKYSSGPYCRKNGKEVQWVAVYDWRKRKKIDYRHGGIRRAWVVDSAAQRFVPAAKDLLEGAVCSASDSE